MLNYVLCLRVSLMGCSPEGCVCWWSNLLKNTSIAVQDSVDVGEGFVYSVDNLPGREYPCCLVTTSLASLCVVSASPTAEVRATTPPFCLYILKKRLSPMIRILCRYEANFNIFHMLRVYRANHVACNNFTILQS